MNDKTRNQVLLVLFLGVLMGALDIAIVAPALPSIQKFFIVGDRALDRHVPRSSASRCPALHGSLSG